MDRRPGQVQEGVHLTEVHAQLCATTRAIQALETLRARGRGRQEKRGDEAQERRTASEDGWAKCAADKGKTPASETGWRPSASRRPDAPQIERSKLCSICVLIIDLDLRFF